MRLRYLTLLLLLFATVSTVAAQCVDTKAMAVEVKSHPDRYRAMLERFVQADTTLTPAEMTTVYFGYAFTPDYVPFESFENVLDAYDAADYRRAWQLAAEAMKLNPVSLELNMVALSSAEHLRPEGNCGMEIRNFGTRCDLLATAILMSGSGTSAASPFRVIAWSDVSRILRNVLGIDRIVGRSKVGDVDAVKVLFPGSEREHIIYFDNTYENLSNQNR